MASTVFVDGVTVLLAAWCNDADTVVYDIFGNGTNYTGNATLPGTATIAGVVTLTNLTASRGVLTNASKQLISADAPLTNSLGGDVALNNTATYFDGPSVAQGTTGTWFASGTVTLVDTAGLAAFNVKLWDGTTVIASARSQSGAAGAPIAVSLSGYITNPAANIRISARDITSTSGKIVSNDTGNSVDSTITAVRVA